MKPAAYIVAAWIVLWLLVLALLLIGLLPLPARAVEAFDGVSIMIFTQAEAQACQRGGGCSPITERRYQELLKAAQACKGPSV
jgi:hypothetical protein